VSSEPAPPAQDPSATEPAGGEPASSGKSSGAQEPPPQGGEDPAQGPPPVRTTGEESPAEEQPAEPAPAQPPSADAAVAAPTGLPEFSPAYRSYGEALQLLDAMARSAPGIARRIELGDDGRGDALVGIELGRPGPVALELRPTVLLVGGLDGVSLSGTEAVLDCVRRLLADPARLPPDVAFVAVPWAAPQELQRALDPRAAAADERPLDEDGDGRFDEDPPDDVDEDGLALSMLVEDPGGEWTFSRDERLLARAADGAAPRFRLVPEGRDDDGDGRFNEDAPGGVVPDRNFPLGREEAWRDARAGVVPLAHAGARALADLALGRRTNAVLLLQGNHGGLATPGGAPGPGGVALPLAADRRLYQRASESFLALTARRQEGLQTLREARGQPVCGAALDWFYAGVGALAVEIAPWGPQVEGGPEVVARDARFQGRLSEPRDPDLGARPLPDERDRAWARWLDDTRGGLGFVDWHPVDLGGVQALVGGWEARTVLNPPEPSLPRALEGIPEFVAALAGGLPRLEVRTQRAEREGEVVQLRARVRNVGLIPTGLAGAHGPGSAGALALELALPPGARLLAGEARVGLGRLDGGELSREVGWIVLAPEGSTFTLRASAELPLPVEVEVRP
jgi:hypothetical protein